VVDLDLVRVMGLAEGGFVTDDGARCVMTGEVGMDVDAGDMVDAEEMLMRYERLLRCRRRTCTHRSDLENIFGTENGTEGVEDEGAVAFDGVDADDDGAGADLAEDELGVAETGLGLRDRVQVELVFGRWEVSDEQL
jgi:hypothetical protein